MVAKRHRQKPLYYGFETLLKYLFALLTHGHSRRKVLILVVTVTRMFTKHPPQFRHFPSTTLLLAAIEAARVLVLAGDVSDVDVLQPRIPPDLRRPRIEGRIASARIIPSTELSPPRRTEPRSPEPPSPLAPRPGSRRRAKPTAAETSARPPGRG